MVEPFLSFWRNLGCGQHSFYGTQQDGLGELQSPWGCAGVLSMLASAYCFNLFLPALLLSCSNTSFVARNHGSVASFAQPSISLKFLTWGCDCLTKGAKGDKEGDAGSWVKCNLEKKLQQKEIRLGLCWQMIHWHWVHDIKASCICPNGKMSNLLWFLWRDWRISSMVAIASQTFLRQIQWH